MQRGRYTPLQEIPVLIESKLESDGLVGLQTVRIVKSEEIDSERKIKNALGAGAWKCFAGLMILKQAYETGDPILMRQAYERLAAGRGLPRQFVEAACSFTPPEGSPTRSAIYFLPNLINQELQGSRFVFWWNRRRRRFMPGLLCPDFQTAIYARVVIDAHFGGGLRICPRCGKSFEATRPDQVYDSTRCREAHRLARWREKRKQGGKK